MDAKIHYLMNESLRNINLKYNRYKPRSYAEDQHAIYNERKGGNKIEIKIYTSASLK